MNDKKEFQIPCLTFTQLKIFEVLSHGKSMTKDVLSEESNIPRTTVYENLVKLQSRKLVRNFKRNNGKLGRSLVLWYVPRFILKVLDKMDKGKIIEVRVNGKKIDLEKFQGYYIWSIIDPDGISVFDNKLDKE